MNRSLRISVIGSGHSDSDVLEAAEETGARIARRNAVLVCGGLGGVMKSACRGAKREGGTTIGILPTRNASDANEFVDFPIVTGMGEARNVIVALSGEGVIAVGGRFGTLSELSFSLKARKPVAAVKSMNVKSLLETPDFYVSTSPSDAVEWVFNQL